jgi:hypothetical protein
VRSGFAKSGAGAGSDLIGTCSARRLCRMATFFGRVALRHFFMRSLDYLNGKRFSSSS